MMVTIKDYVAALEKQDAKEFGKLFASDATYTDSCPKVAGLEQYQCHGREGIDMFFRNLFIFRKFSITDPQIINDREALLVGIYGSYYLIAIATILDYDKDGFIRQMVVRPA